jgi:hypothetical protein
MVNKLVSQFQLMMALQEGGGTVVRLGDGDDYGLYGRRVRNSFGTSLLARGSREELEALKEGSK